MSKSVSKAFQKMHVEKKSKQMSDVTRECFDIAFRWAIPEAVRDMPPRGMYFVGLWSIITATTLFAVIVWETYNADLRTVFLSPSEDSGICTLVQRPITGTYIADTNGSWNSNVYFDSSRAIYQFQLQEFLANQTYWNEVIDTLQIATTEIGAIMQTQPLDINILYWLAWVGNFNVNGEFQYVNFYSDVTVVFNRQYVHGLISDVNSDCNASSDSRYDVGSHVLTTTYSYAEFISNPQCSSIIDPHMLGYDALYDGDDFTMGFDMRSFVTAMAINARIIDLTVLRPLINTIYPLYYNNVTYVEALFYNTRFPGMDPIVCIADATHFDFISRHTNVSCYFAFKNNSYAIPLFNMAGGKSYAPEYCACRNSDGTPGPGLDPDNYCNLFSFFSGYLTFDYGLSDPSLLLTRNPFLDIQQTIPLSQISQYAYEAMFMGAASTYTDEYRYNTTAREEAYAFCNLTYTTCSIVNINSYDANNWAVSDYFYELMNGSCINTASISSQSMQKLAAVPPAPLIETYYNCKKTRTSALIAAVGITVGNINAVVPILFLVFVQAYYILLYYEGKPPVQTYTKEERDDALKALALQLLMMRDNRLPPTRSGSLYKAYPHIHGEAKRLDSTNGTGISGGIDGRSGSFSSVMGSNTGDSGTGVSTLPGNLSILRLLTDELMENAYINVYFNVDTEAEAAKKKRQFRKNSLLRRKTMLAGGDVEANSVDGTVSPLHDSVSVLNSVFDGTLDTMIEFGDGDGNVVSSARLLVAVVDSLMNRLIAAAVEGAEEDFWEVAAHAAVLHKIDLDALHREVLLQPATDFKVYVTLLMKIYQLLQVHIRISYGCTADDAHDFDRVTAYVIGTKTYTVADIDELYNRALAHALQHHIKLDPMTS